MDTSKTPEIQTISTLEFRVTQLEQRVSSLVKIGYVLLGSTLSSLGIELNSIL
jgi:hypothetical protein